MPVDPVVWLLHGHKAGDNNQVLALAEALGWRYDIKRLAYRPWELLTNRLLQVTLAGTDRARSSALEPPWPDLVITAGRRNEPVARWIRRQSGGHTRLVHVGRPWATLEAFDLIVVTPQYFLPGRDNVLHIDLPLHRVTREGLDAIGREWRARFESQPRPWWSVLLGGDSGPFVFTPAKARQLAAWLNRRVAAEGGSVLVTNSARTPADAWAAFREVLAVPHTVWSWRRDADDNPYLAWLALADRLVVTGESMSMLAEAAASGMPLYIYDLSDCPDAGHRLAPCPPWWQCTHQLRWKPFSHAVAMRLAPRRLRRDVSRIQERLVEGGTAAWVGQDTVPGVAVPGESGCALAAARVRDLLLEPVGDSVV
jgi:mitochondrial fission protein ELM1